MVRVQWVQVAGFGAEQRSTCEFSRIDAARGRAEIVRLMFQYAGLPYEDVRLTGVRNITDLA